MYIKGLMNEHYGEIHGLKGKYEIAANMTKIL
jgi:hypothetical protein